MHRKVILFVIILLQIGPAAFADGRLGVLLSPSEIPCGEDFTVTVSAAALEHQVERAIVVQFPDNVRLINAYAADEDGSDTASLDNLSSVASLFTHEKNHQIAAFRDHSGIYSSHYNSVVYVFHFRAPLKVGSSSFRVCLVERGDQSEPIVEERTAGKQKKKKHLVMGSEWRVVAPEGFSEFSFASLEAKRFSKSVRFVSGWSKNSRALIMRSHSVANLKTDSALAPSLFAGEFTVSSWLRTTSPRQIIFQWNHASCKPCALLATNAIGQLVFSQSSLDAPSDSVLTSQHVVADGAWHHVSISKNTFLRAILTVDGKDRDTLQLPSEINHIEGFQIGNSHSINDFSIDELAIRQSAVIPESEPIVSLRDTSSSLVALFHFEDFGKIAHSSVSLRKKNIGKDSMESWTYVPVYLELDSNAVIEESSSPVLADRAVLSLEQSLANKVTFSWLATSEVGVKRYELQRRIATYGEYEKTLEVKAKESIFLKDETHEIIGRANYSAVETLPVLSHDIELYYRLAIIGDKDSVLAYTQPVKLEYGGQRDIFVDQNKPNPFNPKTSISFRLTRTGIVSVTVYDIMGRRVATVVDEKLSQGKHTIDVDASEWPGGIYFYKVKTARTVVTKRMIVAK